MNHSFDPARLHSQMQEKSQNRKSLSAKAKISRNTLGKALDGKPVREDAAKKIATALGTTLEALTNSSTSETPEERRKRLASIGLHDVRFMLGTPALLNLQLAAQRYGVPVADIIAYAPLFFTLEAERSLKARHEAVGNAEAFAEALKAMPHVHSAFYANREVQTALDDEEYSIRSRDLHGNLLNDDFDEHDLEEEDTPFLAHVQRQVEELKLKGAIDWNGYPPGGDHYALFEDALDQITGSDSRAVFALQRRYATVQIIPKDLALRESETPEVTAARVAWLAARVPEDIWNKELEEQERRSHMSLGEILGDLNL